VTTEVARRGSWDRRRIIFGDWTWLVRDSLDVLRLAFVAGTVAFAVMGRSTAVGLTAASAVILIARIADLPRWFDFTLIVAMTAIAWGTALSLYGDYFFYDNVVHSVSPFCYSPVLYISLVRLDVLPDPARVHSVSRRAGIFISTLALGMAVGAGYEVVEWSSDKLLGTHLVKSIDDTGSDLLEDTCGSLAAAILVTVWSTRRWTSRRIPGERPSVGRSGRLRAWAARFRPHPGSPVEILEHRVGGIPLAGKIVAEIGAGTVLLVWPSPALRTVEVVVGVAVAVRAVSDIIELVRGGGGAALRLLVEIAVDVGVAALVLAAPGLSRAVFLYAIGAAIVAFAFVEAAALSTRGRSSRDRWIGGVLSVAALGVGIALLAMPTRVFGATVTLLGIYLVGLGALRLIREVAHRRAVLGR
jgi:uncharacterized membrane protein HdeD (DUF308 family)